ncbi:aldose 1-epimerase-like [Ipomoea triloba]|uniref:aldose 1-epimerase-like n=1 Tax=Ipomoea triloba TaxID=35885 RepID=UPI00125E23E1|nr:aldose 1-epimerase-like [Ipomoea triloba]
MTKVFAPLLLCFLSFALAGLVASRQEEVEFYLINKGDFSVKLTNYGARVASVILPDKNGKLIDIVLGYDTTKEYQHDGSNFGAIVGRVANRIGGAQFTLNGILYKLDANDGNNTLHGGSKGFSNVVWKVKTHKESYITFTYHSPDGDQGFPGDVVAQVTYTLKQNPYKLIVKMNAKALNKPTPVNLAQHNYWNLGGHDSGDILSETLQIFASHITPVDATLIPTGQILAIKNTAFDFLKPVQVGTQMAKLPAGTRGFDNNYVLDDEGAGKRKRVAKVYDERSGIGMEVGATAPGVQLYTANHLQGVKGKGGAVYESHGALCLETQGFPDAVNHPNFPSTIVTPDQPYRHTLHVTLRVQKFKGA